jgi:aryl-alcohol dehydrogenase-like predicted oxidoreductase
MQTCAELGVSMVAFSPVGRSLLTDSPISMAAVQDLAFLKNNPRFITPNYEANFLATAGFRSLAADKGLSAAGLAIAWLLAQGDHVLPIPGTRSVSHFAELLQASNCTLTSGDLEAIESILPIGWAHGDRYSEVQWIGPERYC